MSQPNVIRLAVRRPMRTVRQRPRLRLVAPKAQPAGKKRTVGSKKSALATWKCSHPRTIENTKGVTARLRHGRCRLCQRATDLSYVASEKGRLRGRRAAAVQVANGSHAARQARYEDRKRYEITALQVAKDVRVEVPGVRTLAILGDLQIPFEDPAALDQALDVVARIKPDTVVLNGDVVDCTPPRAGTHGVPRTDPAEDLARWKSRGTLEEGTVARVGEGIRGRRHRHQPRGFHERARRPGDRP